MAFKEFCVVSDSKYIQSLCPLLGESSELVKLSELQKRPVTDLPGAADTTDLADLILCRAGFFDHESIIFTETYICEFHIIELGTEWKPTLMRHGHGTLRKEKCDMPQLEKCTRIPKMPDPVNHERRLAVKPYVITRNYSKALCDAQIYLYKLEHISSTQDKLLCMLSSSI